jgi:hypothetical protein
MVKSKINSSVSYPETKRIASADKDKELEIYEYVLHGIPVNICVGNVCTKYRTDGIYVFPLYLVKPNETVVALGVFEIPSNKYRYYVSPQNEINLDIMPTPLLYKFSTPEYISSIVNGFDAIHEDVNDKVYLARVEKNRQEEIDNAEIYMKEQETEVTNKMNYISKVPEYSKNRSRKRGQRKRF